MRKIICVAGPTASGKTRLGVELAIRFGGEVISADSMQIYRGMNIGTAKPDKGEMRGIPHYMIDVANPEESYSVARYVMEADKCIQDILSRGRMPIVVGGTGLYINALMRGGRFAANSGGEVREKLTELSERQGIGALISMLERFDPESAKRLHPNDTKRIIRACEVYLETGMTISQHNEKSKSVPDKYERAMIVLDFVKREDLYGRIDARVDKMIENGLLEEVKAILNKGVSKNCTSMQAIGYKEAAEYFDGILTLPQAVEKIKRESRRYAKRQLTWFRRENSAMHILQEEPPNIDRVVEIATNFVVSSK